MITSPDQNKPGHAKAARFGAVFSAVALLLMLFGNHRSHVENLWLVGIAVGLVAILAADWALRRNGLRR